METKFLKEALFGGMTSNAFKLGTVLSVGWFWMRRGGCTVLYRGGSFWSVDFGNVVAVTAADDNRISPPAYLQHEPGGTYFYVVRRANCCGYLEQGLQGVVRVTIDAEGYLSKPGPNVVFGLKTGQVGAGCVRLSWYYCPLEQQSEPVGFRIYTDAGSGEIDYENAAGVVEYEGKGFYSYQSDELGDGRYRFAVRAEDKVGTEGISVVRSVDIVSRVLEPIEVLSVESV